MSTPRCLRVLIVLIIVLMAVPAVPVIGTAQGNSGSAHACQKGNWQTLARAGSPTIPFANQDECVSYGANGGTIVAFQPDSDGDGVADSSDNCPSVANPGQADSDGDGIGDACDAPDPTLVVTTVPPDTPTPTPPPTLVATTPADIPTPEPTVISTLVPNTPTPSPVTIDTDGDGIADAADNCPATANPSQGDADRDGTGDACDLGDFDGDGEPDWFDNCPAVRNGINPIDGTGQEDADGDGIGDACDPGDTDGDGLSDEHEVALNTNPAVADTDGDGLNDGFEVQNGSDPLDTAGAFDPDGVPTVSDNCPAVVNAAQRDVDRDGIGDSCDSGDFDHDGLSDAEESSPNGTFTNPAVVDTDGDGWSDGYEVLVAATSPLLPDTDSDGIIDSLDPDPLVYSSGGN